MRDPDQLAAPLLEMTRPTANPTSLSGEALGAATGHTDRVVSLKVTKGGQWVPVPLDTWTGTVYHYTDSAGLIGIVKSNRLWASALLGLNDPTELTYGVERLRAEVEDWQPGRLQDALRGHLEDERMARIKDATFVVCGSTDGDMLSQWRGYSGARGYAVGIDPKPMFSVTGADDSPPPFGTSVTTVPRWCQVAYDEDKQRAVIRRVLEFLEGGDPENAIYIEMLVGTLISLLKPAAFRDEHEVRLVVTAPPGTTESFRPGRFGVLPYLNVACLTENPETEPESASTTGRPGALPLVSITCGPGDTDEQRFAVEAATRLARANHYSVDVRRSRIRFRF